MALGDKVSAAEPIKAAIAKLEALVASGDATEADVAQLAALKEKLKGAGSGAIAGDSDKK